MWRELEQKVEVRAGVDDAEAERHHVEGVWLEPERRWDLSREIWP